MVFNKVVLSLIWVGWLISVWVTGIAQLCITCLPHQAFWVCLSFVCQYLCASLPYHGAATEGLTCVVLSCSFFLQLSLLDLPCCGFPACAAAAAALSLALSFFGEDCWPKLLQHYTALTDQVYCTVPTRACWRRREGRTLN